MRTRIFTILMVLSTGVPANVFPVKNAQGIRVELSSNEMVTKLPLSTVKNAPLWLQFSEIRELLNEVLSSKADLFLSTALGEGAPAAYYPKTDELPETIAKSLNRKSAQPALVIHPNSSPQMIVHEVQHWRDDSEGIITAIQVEVNRALKNADLTAQMKKDFAEAIIEQRAYAREIAYVKKKYSARRMFLIWDIEGHEQKIHGPIYVDEEVTRIKEVFEHLYSDLVARTSDVLSESERDLLTKVIQKREIPNSSKFSILELRRIDPDAWRRDLPSD